MAGVFKPQPGGRAFILGPNTYGKLIDRLGIKGKKGRPTNNTDTNLAFVKNDTATEFKPYRVVKLTTRAVEDETLPDHFNTTCFNATLPAASDENLGFTTDRIAADETGAVIVAGIANAYVNVTDTAHRFAVPDGTDTLQSATTGPVKIMHDASSTGAQHLKVLLLSPGPAGDPGGSTVLWGQDDSSGGAATFTGSQTKEIPIVANAGSTDTSVYDGIFKAAGTYQFDICLRVLIDELKSLNSNEFAGTPGYSDYFIHMFQSQELTLKLYLHDDASSPASGTKLHDVKELEAETKTVWEDGLYELHATNIHKMNRKKYIQISKTVSISQSYLDGLTGDAALYLEGTTAAANSTDTLIVDPCWINGRYVPDEIP